MTKTKRLITVEENGQVIYQGEDHRYYNRDYSTKGAFGISNDTWVKIIFGGAALVGLYYQTDARISSNEDFKRQQVEINKQFIAYIQNADNYMSAKTGREFRGGRPIDGPNAGYVNKATTDS